MARKPRGPTSEGEGPVAENRKRGTSFKLNMLDALLLDDRATGADFKIGHVIIKHMNMQDGACFPSVKTIAAWANYADEKYVRERIKHLKEIGWLLVSRGNRRLSNSYDFDPAYLDILSRKAEILERRSDKRKPNSGAAEGLQPLSDRSSVRVYYPPD